jgi:hypothetical protein
MLSASVPIDRGSERKGNHTSKMAHYTHKSFAVFGNILVKCHNKEKWHFTTQDSFTNVDDFLFEVNKLNVDDMDRESTPRLLELVDEVSKGDNVSSTSSQRERLRKIEQLIEENASS